MISSVTGGPGGGDAELGARRVGLAAHLHHAAEQEQVDPLDLDALAPRRQRMPELVQQDRGEEARRGHHGDGVDGRVARVERPRSESQSTKMTTKRTRNHE